MHTASYSEICKPTYLCIRIHNFVVKQTNCNYNTSLMITVSHKLSFLIDTICSEPL